MDIKSISAFLYFGYVPELPDNIYNEPWVKYKNMKIEYEFNTMNEVDLIEEGVKALRSVFHDIKPNFNHIVPISGGLDSRAILAGLIEQGLSDRITTITFGSPGTLDFEIGKYLSKKYKLNHEVINLTKVNIEQNELLETSKEVNSLLWVFDVYYNRLIPKHFGMESIYWSGYLGDRLAGLKLVPEETSTTWEEAIDWFIRKNKFVTSLDLRNPQINLKESLPLKPLLSNDCVNYDDQLNYAIRQNYNKKILIHREYQYRKPLLDPKWLKFITNIPNKYKKDKYLYKKILMQAYPDLFSEPQKMPLAFSYNMPIRQMLMNAKISSNYLFKMFISPDKATLPGTNYIDFDKSIRDRSDLRDIVYENLMDLAKREILTWIDIYKLWSEHMHFKGNHGLALTTLVSLEIYLKTR